MDGKRGLEVAALVAAGYADKEIARQLGISFRTVRTHLERMSKKLGLQGRVALAEWYWRQQH